MADNLSKLPRKSILKNSSSFETQERQREASKETKWDEMNIIATFHPKDKDYGHMKIEEPKTPYNYVAGEAGEELDCLDADLLAKKIQAECSDTPKALVQPVEDRDESSEEEEETDEEKAKRKMFEAKRKQHYNEFYAVKLARKLMEKDDDDDGISDSKCENDSSEELTEDPKDSGGGNAITE